MDKKAYFLSENAFIVIKWNNREVRESLVPIRLILVRENVLLLIKC